MLDVLMMPARRLRAALLRSAAMLARCFSYARAMLTAPYAAICYSADYDAATPLLLPCWLLC